MKKILISSKVLTNLENIVTQKTVKDVSIETKLVDWKGQRSPERKSITLKHHTRQNEKEGSLTVGDRSLSVYLLYSVKEITRSHLTLLSKSTNVVMRQVSQEAYIKFERQEPRKLMQLEFFFYQSNT